MQGTKIQHSNSKTLFCKHLKPVNEPAPICGANCILAKNKLSLKNQPLDSMHTHNFKMNSLQEGSCWGGGGGRVNKREGEIEL